MCEIKENVLHMFIKLYKIRQEINRLVTRLLLKKKKKKEQKREREKRWKQKEIQGKLVCNSKIRERRSAMDEGMYI